MNLMFYSRSAALRTLTGQGYNDPTLSNADLQEAIACELTGEDDPIPVVLDDLQLLTMRDLRAEGTMPDNIEFAEC